MQQTDKQTQTDDFRVSPYSGVSLIIGARERDLGSFSVRRFLPHGRQRKVGPFVFFDHMGPAEFAPGDGIDVRPHPHIGLATITYLYEGSIRHRDSLGYVQDITPGAVNWMTAGRGIVHSERTGDEVRARGQCMHGFQVWVALPEESEETEPEFLHFEADEIPEFTQGDARLRLIAGQVRGTVSPVKTFSSLFYLDVALPASASVEVPDNYEERAAYIASGQVSVAGESIDAFNMVVFEAGADIRITATRDTRLVMLGGEPLSERILYWNFVSSSKERLEQAKDDWRNGRFGKVPGDDEFIPLPEDD